MTHLPTLRFLVCLLALSAGIGIGRVSATGRHLQQLASDDGDVQTTNTSATDDGTKTNIASSNDDADVVSSNASGVDAGTDELKNGGGQK
eukprot:5708179-Pyramimonas_sp.AAC.3